MRSYADAASFRQALDARLRRAARDRAVQIQGLRLKVAIERILARLFREPRPPWLLKGGYAMELRFRPNARTTRDLDLTLRSTLGERDFSDRAQDVHDMLVDAAQHPVPDFFTFVIPPSRRSLTQAPGGGAVFNVTARVAGRDFARFHIDVGSGDVHSESPEPLTGDTLLSFAGIEPPTALAVPKSQQFAEKIHAYTFRWIGRENTRSRDLVDMVLFIERGDLDPQTVRLAVARTFRHRRQQSIPVTLDPPPTAWATEFPSMAHEAGISTANIHDAFLVLNTFWTSLGPIHPEAPPAPEARSG